LSATEFWRIAKALADPQRCQILERAAAAGELSCSHIVAACEVSQATISHHLKELTTAGLLERWRDGQFVRYRFHAEVLISYTDELHRRMRVRPARRQAARPR
jgi:DNA-binding transcriptional ArsR family regulator